MSWSGPRKIGKPSPPYKGTGKVLTKKGKEIKSKVQSKINVSEHEKKYGVKESKIPNNEKFLFKHHNYKEFQSPALAFQDKYLEHTIPIKDGVTSYFEEKAGDIFRELTKGENAFPSYFMDKFEKYNKDYKRLNSADIKQLKNAFKGKEKILNEWRQTYTKRVALLQNIVKNKKYSMHQKEAMLSALKLMGNTVKWSKHPSLQSETIYDALRELEIKLNKFIETNQKN